MSSSLQSAPDVKIALMVDARQREIARVMLAVDMKRATLAKRIESGCVDEQDALVRNASMPGRLGELWAQFISLPKHEKLSHLSSNEFNGMHWQSLLQCSPYLKGSL